MTSFHKIRYKGQTPRYHAGELIIIGETLLMDVKDNDRNKNTDLVPIPTDPPAEDQKLRRLTDDEIIRGFRYLMNKDKKKD